jgi:glycosyltransferase involved in cell wall biosynthesis
MCLTYGRPAILAEAIQSFLQQDYPGEKELIVLNDFPQQVLVCDDPQVSVSNLPRRFHTLGEKRNACAALATHDLLFVWDDDDIFLPHRLSYCVRSFDPLKRFFKPSRAFTLNNGQLGGPVANLFHSGACFSRSLFNEVHGYAHINSGQDMELELAFECVIGRGKNFNTIRPEEIYYIYRWGGIGSFHLSGFGRDQPGQPTGMEKVGRYVRTRMEKGELQSGTILVQPAWQIDYRELVVSYLAQRSRPELP